MLGVVAVDKNETMRMTELYSRRVCGCQWLAFWKKTRTKLVAGVNR